MRIPWKIKSALYRLIDHLGLHSLLYTFQRYISSRSPQKIKNISDDWERHLTVIKKYSVGDSLFEFGGGKSLAQNLFLSSVCERQLVVDLVPMLDIKLSEAARQNLEKRLKLRSDAKIRDVTSLTKYGITYLAPADARNIGYPDESFSCCVSTNTLEHIPSADIERIFAEIYRLLRPEGIVSFKIDYSDHYSHTDPRIGSLNFLNMSEKDWCHHNHSVHYQNRLRHMDYMNSLARAGFEILLDEVYYDLSMSLTEREAIDTKLGKFASATSGFIVARKS